MMVLAVISFSLSPAFWVLDLPFLAITLFLVSVCLCVGVALCPQPEARAKRRGSNLCQRCGYDLRATYDRCPECGLALSRIRRSGGSVIYLKLLAGGALPSRPCRKCGLELAGVTGLQCPQCGERLLENEAKLLRDRCRESNE